MRKDMKVREKKHSGSGNNIRFGMARTETGKR